MNRDRRSCRNIRTVLLVCLSLLDCIFQFAPPNKRIQNFVCNGWMDGWMHALVVSIESNRTKWIKSNQSLQFFMICFPDMIPYIEIAWFTPFAPYHVTAVSHCCSNPYMKGVSSFLPCGAPRRIKHGLPPHSPSLPTGTLVTDSSLGETHREHKCDRLDIIFQCMLPQPVSIESWFFSNLLPPRRDRHARLVGPVGADRHICINETPFTRSYREISLSRGLRMKISWETGDADDDDGWGATTTRQRPHQYSYCIAFVVILVHR